MLDVKQGISCLSLHDQGHPANEADTVGDRSGEPVDCRDSFAKSRGSVSKVTDA